MDIRKFVRKLCSYALRHAPGSEMIPDKLYLSLLYRLHVGGRMNWDNPTTFNQKIQWLKINDRNPSHTMMVDKYAVKEYVATVIGKDYVIPTIGVWDSFDEIDFSKLPDQFVLKTTHGGGGLGVAVINDKSNADMAKIRERITASLNKSIWGNYREWPYRDVPRRIIAEKFLDDGSGELRDYKFFCMNGEPKFLKVDFNRFKDHRANYYDMQFKLLPYGEVDCRPDKDHIETMPENFDVMVALARKLSRNHPFLRVDLYNIKGKIYFGEMTFFPASGLGRWTDDITDLKIGEMLKLPDTSKPTLRHIAGGVSC